MFDWNFGRRLELEPEPQPLRKQEARAWEHKVWNGFLVSKDAIMTSPLVSAGSMQQSQQIPARAIRHHSSLRFHKLHRISKPSFSFHAINENADKGAEFLNMFKDVAAAKKIHPETEVLFKGSVLDSCSGGSVSTVTVALIGITVFAFCGRVRRRPAAVGTAVVRLLVPASQRTHCKEQLRLGWDRLT
jgi:hypothetical protein